MQQFNEGSRRTSKEGVEGIDLIAGVEGGEGMVMAGKVAVQQRGL